jgi:glycosyltransferase involved in cell wall biosynthesis
VIHKTQNEGLPRARKTGLDVAGGEYVAYIDSDDWIERAMLRSMYAKAINGNYDMVSCGFFLDGFPPSINHKFVEINGLDKVGTIKKMIRYNNWNVSGKLIKRSLFHAVKFPEFQNAEDAVISLQLVYYADRILFSPSKYYHYCYNDTSITFSYNMRRKNREAYNNFRIIIDFFEEKYGEKICLFEPELSDKINYLKYALIRYNDIRTKDDFLELYPQSKNYIFKGTLPFSARCLIFLCGNGIFMPIKILNYIKPVRDTPKNI